MDGMFMVMKLKDQYYYNRRGKEYLIEGNEMNIDEQKLKEKLSDDVLHTIMEAAIYIDNELVGSVDKVEASNFVDTCFAIAGKKANWPE